MATLLLFLSVMLTIICLVCLIVGIVHGYEALGGVSAIMLVVVVLFCWGLLGNLVACKSSVENITATVVKTKTAVIVEYGGVRRIFEDAKTYNEINDSTKFQFRKVYNMYGAAIDSAIILSTKPEQQ